MGGVRGVAVGGVTNCTKNPPLSLLVLNPAGLRGQKCPWVCFIRGCSVGGVGWNGEFLVGELTGPLGCWGGRGWLTVLTSLAFGVSMTKICRTGGFTGKVRTVEVLGFAISVTSRVVIFELVLLGSGPTGVVGWLGPAEGEPAVTSGMGLGLALLLARPFLPTVLILAGVLGTSFREVCEGDRVSGV